MIRTAFATLGTLLAFAGASARAEALVSNIDLSDSADLSLSDKVRMQEFTVGEAGASVGSIEIKFSSGSARLDAPAATLRRWDGSSHVLVVELAGPGKLAAGDNKFYAPESTALDANTVYAVRLEGGGSGVALRGTTDDGESGRSGWSIRDESHHRETAASSYETSATALMIRANEAGVRGAFDPFEPPLAPNLTLSETTSDDGAWTVSWSGPELGDFYTYVELEETPPGGTASVSTYYEAPGSASISGKTATGAYSYRVRGCRNICSAWSGTLTVTFAASNDQPVVSGHLRPVRVGRRHPNRDGDGDGRRLGRHAHGDGEFGHHGRGDGIGGREDADGDRGVARRGDGRGHGDGQQRGGQRGIGRRGVRRDGAEQPAGGGRHRRRDGIAGVDAVGGSERDGRGRGGHDAYGECEFGRHGGGDGVGDRQPADGDGRVPRVGDDLGDGDGRQREASNDTSAEVEFTATVPNSQPVIGSISDVTVPREPPMTVPVMVEVTDGDAGDTHTVTAESSDEDVATVSVSGKTLTVTAVSRGAATITVGAQDDSEAPNAAAEAVGFGVSVPNSQPVVGPISDVTVSRGSTVTTTASVTDRDSGDTHEVTATSSDADVATVSVSGETLTVSGVAAGSATISVTASDKSGASNAGRSPASRPAGRGSR